MSGWDLTEVKESLPEGGSAGTAPATSEVTASEAPSTQPHERWAEKIAYDYEGAGDREWDGNARVYEWDGEEGDIGPEHPGLENILFGLPEDRNPQGINFNEIAQINVTQEGMKRVEHITTFEAAGLHPAMLRNIQLCGYLVPTPIQKYCIPAIKMGHDLIAIAQTGSGKTAAYLIPILNHLMGKAKKLAAWRPLPQDLQNGQAGPVRAEPLVVIICPARELAVQIFNEARKFCYRTMLRPCVIYGGGPLREQISQLQRGCDILVASPGRLIDMMDRPEVLTLRRVKYMVIDEADEMLEASWQEDLNKILSGGEQEEGNIKYMLFSATFPVAVRQLAKTHLSESHVRIRVGRIGSTHQNIIQDVIWVEPALKKKALLDLLGQMKPARTIIFVNSRRMADELDDFLYHNNMPSTAMHADRTQREREDSMRAFRAGKAPLLVATGVTARGIDVRNVAHVINYDLPSMDHGGIQEYIHRIGRTGRIGHKGTATSFYTENDGPIGEILAKTLMETGQRIPDFLAHHVEGQKLDTLKFENDTDEELDNQNNGGGGGDGGWPDDSGAGGGKDDADDDFWGTKPSATDDKAASQEDSGSGKANGGDDAWGSSNGNANGGGDAWGSSGGGAGGDSHW